MIIYFLITIFNFINFIVFKINKNKIMEDNKIHDKYKYHDNNIDNNELDDEFDYQKINSNKNLNKFEETKKITKRNLYQKEKVDENENENANVIENNQEKNYKKSMTRINTPNRKSPFNDFDFNDSKLFIKKLTKENEDNNLRELISTSKTQLEKINQKFNFLSNNNNKKSNININNTLKSKKDYNNYNNHSLNEDIIKENDNSQMKILQDKIHKEREREKYIRHIKNQNVILSNKNKEYNNNNLNNTKEDIENFNYPFPISQEIRISNLEKRLESIEKILHFYDEMFKLKNEEKLNEERIDKNKLIELSKKINYIEENNKFNNIKIRENNDVDKKIENLEKKFKKLQDNNNSIGEYYAKKLSEFEEIYKNIESFLETKVEDKIITLQKNYENKLEDIVNLINEFTAQLDKNEFNLVENREGIRNIQVDHIDFLKIVTILKEKTDSMDYLMDQITDLKFKYNKVLNIYGMQNTNSNINFQEDEEEQIVKNITNMNINDYIDR
jgi:hypothetical protein